MKQTTWQEYNVPIKLNEAEEDDPFEEEIDRLRQQKEMQQKLKQQQAAIHDHNKKTAEIRQKIVQDILPKHKGLKLAYDYDGTYMLAKDLTQVKVNQRQEFHKITQVDTVFQPQKPVQQAVIENANIKKEQTRTHKSKTNPPQIFEATTAKPFEGFLPNQGVKLIYSDQNQEVVKCQEINNWGDGKRMTRKEFEAIKGEGQRTMNNNLKQQMLQQINSDIVELKEPKTTPAAIDVLRQVNDLKTSQSYTNLQEPINQRQQGALTSKSRHQQQGSKINVADKNLLNQLLS